MDWKDNFASKLSDVTLSILYRLNEETAIPFDPSSSVEMELYFLRVEEDAPLNEIDKIDFFRQRILSDFKSIHSNPEWIQGEEWQISQSGKPMLFVGQVNIPHNTSPLHDSCSFYVFFCSLNGETRTIVQVE